ncbi:MAG: protein kinase [Pseudomonadota bacterium]
MEYVQGVPIDRWCDGQRLDVHARVRLFLQAIDAVGHAHRHLLVHRDLKPSNLLVDAAGQVKLLDFGIAKQLQDPEFTVFADRAVTFGYASPEQLLDVPITTATDIWQLGIVAASVAGRLASLRRTARDATGPPGAAAAGRSGTSDKGRLRAPRWRSRDARRVRCGIAGETPARRPCRHRGQLFAARIHGPLRQRG